MNKIWLIILAVLIVLGIGAGIYYMMYSNNKTETTTKNNTSAQTQLEFKAYKSGNQN